VGTSQTALLRWPLHKWIRISPLKLSCGSGASEGDTRSCTTTNLGTGTIPTARETALRFDTVQTDIYPAESEFLYFISVSQNIVTHPSSETTTPCYPPCFATKRFAHANSAVLTGAAPYLFHQMSAATFVQSHHCVDDRSKDVPSNDRHTQKRADAAEYQRHNASCREAGRQGRNSSVLAFQVQDVDGVTRCVTGDRDTEYSAGLEVILGNCQGLLQL